MSQRIMQLVGGTGTILVTFFAGVSRADVLQVPEQYATVQLAIDAAFDGDFVELADGTYAGLGNRDLDFGGKTITVRSASGDPALCVIDCEASGRGFYFHTGESAAATVLGITITNGAPSESSPHGANGGAVCCVDGSNPTLINCVLSGNAPIGWNPRGGGLYCYNGSPTLSGCVISANSHSGCWTAYSSPRLIDCTVSGNLTGCSFNYGGTAVLTRCAIASNSETGVWNSASAVLVECTISGNSASEFGGGVRNLGILKLISCTIAGNTANYGGGICGGAELVNCALSGNTAAHGGAAYGSPTLINCSVSGNLAFNYSAGGIYYDGGSPKLTNSIVWGNTPLQIVRSGSNLVVSYCDVQGGWPGTANINLDPLFVRAPSDGGDGWGDNPNTPDVDESANDDYGDLRVLPGSPCIDSGNNAAVPADAADLDGDGNITEPLPMDHDDQQRFADDPATPNTGAGTPPIVDRGAFELIPELPALTGDLNCDGAVNLQDINRFVQYLSDYINWWAAYPGCPPANGDINGDEVYPSFGDINPFVELLTQ
jgi:hypothetical protein